MIRRDRQLAPDFCDTQPSVWPVCSGPCNQGSTVTWVPVTEEYPEEGTPVLVNIAGVHRPVWVACTYGRDWFDPCEGIPIVGVTHWCEFPMGVDP
jgi:hypothetical protein